MSSKYLFRVYHFDKNGNISSPFLSGHTGKFGSAEIADSTRDSTRDDVGNEFGNLWHKGKLYQRNPRHFGFSAFGKVDPRYSIFSGEDFEGNKKLLRAIQKEITKGVPESAKGQHLLKDYYEDNEEDDWEFLTNDLYTPKERTGHLSKFRGQKGSADAFTISPEFFDFDSDQVWDDLAYDIDMYDTFNRLHPGAVDDGDRVVLATTPESKIISVDDLIKNGYTQQRDFPSELVTSEITPIRVFSEYPKAVANYDRLRDKGASGKEAFAESFKIEPSKIVSDEQLKNIYKDICFFVDGRNKYKNLVSSIKEFGQ